MLALARLLNPLTVSQENTLRRRMVNTVEAVIVWVRLISLRFLRLKL
jgi:hypothetical protein